MTKKFILLSTVLLFSCTALEHENLSKNESDDLRQHSQVIPPQQALDNLTLLMGELYGTTKSADFSVDDIQVFGGVQTRSGDMELPDTLVYVLNFSDSSGFAVMSAQTSILTDVFCITESGSLSIEDLYEGLMMLETMDTQSLTRSEQDTDADTTLIDVGEKFVPMLLAASAVNQYSPELSLRSVLPALPVNYKTITKIGPLLQTKWNQRKPFNNFRSDGAPAGCVAVATAQILTYNERGSYNGRTFDWQLLKTVRPASNYTSLGSNQAQAEASELLRIVGLKANCNIKYGADASGGYADGAKRTFKNFGYKNVRKYFGFENADKNRVIDMLTNHYPTYTDGSGPEGGHAWVIDGLFIRDKINIISGENLGKDNLFHINWGWKGESDGYYNQGVFDATKRIDVEDGIDNNLSQQSYKFTWNYRTITYSL